MMLSLIIFLMFRLLLAPAMAERLLRAGKNVRSGLAASEALPGEGDRQLAARTEEGCGREAAWDRSASKEAQAARHQHQLCTHSRKIFLLPTPATEAASRCGG